MANNNDTINWSEVYKMEADTAKTYQQMLFCDQKLLEIGQIPLTSFQESDLLDPASLCKVVQSLQWQVNAVKYRSLLGLKTMYDEVIKVSAVAKETKDEVVKIKASLDLIESRLETLEKRLSTMEDRMTSRDKLLKGVDGKLDGLKKEMDEKHNVLDKKLDYLMKEIPGWIQKAVEEALKNVGPGTVQSPPRGQSTADDSVMRSP